jgi:hypothetical protein
LARTLFPDLLQLSTVDDYKDNILSLLSTLVDSGYLKGTDYDSHFPQLYFDAKIQWKKQEGRDERRLQKKEEDNSDEISGNEGEGTGDADSPLDDYAVLLMPFYDKNPTVPHFFNKLLQSKDASLRLSTSALLLRNNKPVADSIIRALAVSDLYRSRLLKSLEAIHRGERFPRSFRNQVDIARSLLVGNRSDNEGVDIQFVDKKFVQFKEAKGTIYFFKYKLNKDDDWQIGLSGLQPVNPKEVNTDNEFVRLTGKKIRPDSPVRDQFEQQLKKLLFSKRKSAASFYLDNEYYGGKNEED